MSYILVQQVVFERLSYSMAQWFFARLHDDIITPDMSKTDKYKYNMRQSHNALAIQSTRRICFDYIIHQYKTISRDFVSSQTDIINAILEQFVPEDDFKILNMTQKYNLMYYLIRTLHGHTMGMLLNNTHNLLHSIVTRPDNDADPLNRQIFSTLMTNLLTFCGNIREAMINQFTMKNTGIDGRSNNILGIEHYKAKYDKIINDLYKQQKTLETDNKKLMLMVNKFMEKIDILTADIEKYKTQITTLTEELNSKPVMPYMNRFVESNTMTSSVTTPAPVAEPITETTSASPETTSATTSATTSQPIIVNQDTAPVITNNIEDVKASPEVEDPVNMIIDDEIYNDFGDTDDFDYEEPDMDLMD